ncbi:hypothetical protein L2E82_40804 [Cichorium intybus]|uniref:Uncharacterized protein n=1 Tax=Cichorium intybus TaxID=13427 RepID=A0ACB9ANP5_CICIN|nr:hypothetical protein L2E82_40804 [Cichorium intybus]
MSKRLRALLDERFFNSCLVHEEDKKNEENSFCMDCCFSLCVHCMPHHQSHRILQIRRYMYNDVLRLKDAQKIFDCSLIQSYTTNSEKVVLLRPRQRVSFPIRGTRCTCLVCNQNIKSSFVYCSMVCKLSNEAASSGDQRVYAYSSTSLGRSFLVSGSVTECLVSIESSVEESSTNTESMVGKQKISATTSTRKLHGRKCVPQRAPLF